VTNTESFSFLSERFFYFCDALPLGINKTYQSTELLLSKIYKSLKALTGRIPKAAPSFIDKFILMVAAAY
jgi:hypothetical protein